MSNRHRQRNSATKQCDCAWDLSSEILRRNHRSLEDVSGGIAATSRPGP